MISAIIFIPACFADDTAFAQECLDYCAHRGYEVTTIVRDWDTVQTMLGLGMATVVVLARQAHLGRAYLGRNYLRPGRRAHLELVGHSRRDLTGGRSFGEETQALRQPAAAAWAGRIEEVIDGDGPIPEGLDPDSVHALRRIARALSRNSATYRHR